MQTTRETEAIRIGKRLRYMRRVHDRTQEELADMLGVSVTWVSRIERGVKMPNLPFLFHVSNALRVPVHELLPPRHIPAKRKHEHS
jgi:transcriptional regulator with XRE-family HTH domain